MRKVIATFMMLSTPPIALALGLLYYMHNPLDSTWQLVELLVDYIALPAWVIGGAVLFPTDEIRPGTSPGRFF